MTTSLVPPHNLQDLRKMEALFPDDKATKRNIELNALKSNQELMAIIRQILMLRKEADQDSP